MPYRSHVDYKALVEQHGKRCPTCTKRKPATDFHVNATRTDGRAVYCKVCMAERYGDTKRRYEKSEARKSVRAAYYQRNPTASADQSRRHRRKVKAAQASKPKKSKRQLENERLRREMDAKDQMYPSHFRSEHDVFRS